MDVSSITNNAGTKRFMDLLAGGAPAPTWLGYLIAAIEFLGGIAILVGFKTRWIAWAFVAWLMPEPRAVAAATWYRLPAVSTTDVTVEVASPHPTITTFVSDAACTAGYVTLTDCPDCGIAFAC